MTAPYGPGEREKVVSKLPPMLRQELKVRAAQLSVDIKDAVTEGIQAWRSTTEPLATVDTSGGTPFSTYIPTGLNADFKADCASHGLSYTQGIAQAIRLWLDTHPYSTNRRQKRPTGARRIIMGNQKGGVGKSTTAAGVAEALAEMGYRVCVVDFDAQCHLTQQLGLKMIGIDEPSVAKHMLGEAKGELADLLVPIEAETFGGRLFVLPGCKDAFLLDAKLATTRHVRVKETALEKALEPIEQDFDYIIIDCPPSLGYTMDTAIYYARTRDGEEEGTSGIFIPVQAEDSSADAFDMLYDQIQDLSNDLDLDIALLGFIVTLYDARRGYVATSSLDNWKQVGDPPVIAVIPQMKDQLEAVRLKQPLLSYAPTCDQASAMRTIARSVA
ncbi:ParA family protein [Streptomyces sp. JJ66]|uniref:ParA family protein n=1 Tax=Streptomyces sp. JJ66 TaxID=2803843 RepID=UPI001C55EA9D|nr:ParA family protein [Streptomyces sp. JJ66]MBW1603541.1 ParA family protein [Streptomyces sp. JJ66]